MGFYQRLLRTEEPRIALHAFAAACGELTRLKLTRADLLATFQVTVAEETDFDAVRLRLSILSPSELHEVLLLVDVGMEGYDTEVALKAKLGIVIV